MGIYDTTIYVEEAGDWKTALMRAACRQFVPGEMGEGYKPFVHELALVLGWLRDYGSGTATLEGYFEIGQAVFAVMRNEPSPVTDLDAATLEQARDEIIAALVEMALEKQPDADLDALRLAATFQTLPGSDGFVVALATGGEVW